jgi:hypothetical protein
VRRASRVIATSWPLAEDLKAGACLHRPGVRHHFQLIHHQEEGLDDASQSIQAHLDRVTPERRRRDAHTLLKLMTQVTGDLRTCGEA